MKIQLYSSDDVIEEFYEAISEFEGASRRLEPIYEANNIRAFRDYAHAPSKVGATTSATKETFEDQKLVACLELHTFSSLSKEFIKQYRDTLSAADAALVYFNPRVIQHKKLPNLTKEDVQKAFNDVSIFILTLKNIICFI